MYSTDSVLCIIRDDLFTWLQAIIIKLGLRIKKGDVLSKSFKQLTVVLLIYGVKLSNCGVSGSPALTKMKRLLQCCG